MIDLTAAPPALSDTITVGKQPSGLAISRKGDLALVANRYGKSLSILSIAFSKVTLVGDVPLEQEVSGGRHHTRWQARVRLPQSPLIALACWSIDGQKVTYDKAMDIPVAFNPYNVDITPNGKFAIVSTTGAGRNNGDALAVIDTSGPHPHTTGLMTPGTGPEGFTISPDGKWVAAALLLGSGGKQSDWFKTKGGELALMSLDSETGEMTVTDRAALGGLPEGLAFSPTSDYVYVGNYFDTDLQVFHLQRGKLKPAGPNISLGGQPASMRALPH